MLGEHKYWVHDKGGAKMDSDSTFSPSIQKIKLDYKSSQFFNFFIICSVPLEFHQNRLFHGFVKREDTSVLTTLNILKTKMFLP